MKAKKLRVPTYAEVQEAYEVIALGLVAELKGSGDKLGRLHATWDEERDGAALSYELEQTLTNLLLDRAIACKRYNEYFRIAKEASRDRPSAFTAWCGATGYRGNRVELQMHAHDQEVPYLRKVFKGRVPAELLVDDWCT